MGSRGLYDRPPLGLLLYSDKKKNKKKQSAEEDQARRRARPSRHTLSLSLCLPSAAR